jgi:omega-6 fatty acid desaturase (delta-12 desaturase)
LLILEALLLVRIFIFFHDCCHNSFFAAHCANMLLGIFVIPTCTLSRLAMEPFTSRYSG